MVGESGSPQLRERLPPPRRHHRKHRASERVIRFVKMKDLALVFGSCVLLLLLL